jgi:hypothetical protein
MLDEQAVREYFETSTLHLNELQSRAVWADSDVWARAEQAILDGLLRLNRLPRSDPYWATWANDRPTFAKLAEYCTRLRNADPADLGAIWLEVALNLYCCANDFGTESWRALHHNGCFDVAWPIDAAAVVQLYSGVPTVLALTSLVHELGEEQAARSYLAVRSKCSDVHAAGWARHALRTLEDGVSH